MDEDSSREEFVPSLRTLAEGRFLRRVAPPVAALIPVVIALRHGVVATLVAVAIGAVIGVMLRVALITHADRRVDSREGDGVILAGRVGFEIDQRGRLRDLNHRTTDEIS